MKRYHVIFEGQVQGVGFRWICMRYAQQLGITGSVRNMSNGMVEMFAQGTEEHLNLLLERLKENQGWIQVENVTVQEIPLQPGETTFQPIL